MVKNIKKRVNKIIQKIKRLKKNKIAIEDKSKVEKLEIIKYYNLYDKVLEWYKEKYNRNIIKKKIFKISIKLIISKGINLYLKNNINFLIYREMFYLSSKKKNLKVVNLSLN